MSYSIAQNIFFSISVLNRPGVEHNLSVVRKRPLINAFFVSDEWHEWRFRNLPMFVGFFVHCCVQTAIRVSLDKAIEEW